MDNRFGQSSSIVAFVALVGVFACGGADGLEASERIGGLRVSFYAPDWTWQKRDINALVVLDNEGGEAVEPELSLRFPPGSEEHFAIRGEDADTALSIPTTVPPGETVREAFTGITARDGVPRQEYRFVFVVRVGDAVAEVPYRLRTIRGAAVNPGRWALYLPAGVALMWSVVFALVLRRLAPQGAWMTPSAAMQVSEEDIP